MKPSENLVHKVEPGCIGCVAALICITGKRPHHRQRCLRCGLMHVTALMVGGSPGANFTSRDIAVTVRCPLPERMVDREISGWDPPDDHILCHSCNALLLKRNKGGISKWKKDGRPKTKGFQKNVATSLAPPTVAPDT